MVNPGLFFTVVMLQHGSVVFLTLTNNQQRMLYEIGIYDKDIRHIIDTIGNDFDNMDDLLVLLETKWDDYRRKVSFISQFLIENILKHS